MKFDCGEDWEHKHKRLSAWHSHFVWFPVRVGNHDCRWLEVIERKGNYSGYGGDWWWEYRIPVVKD